MVNWHLNNIVHQSGQSGSAVSPGIDPRSLVVRLINILSLVAFWVEWRLH